MRKSFAKGSQWRGFESNHEMPQYMQIKSNHKLIH